MHLHTSVNPECLHYVDSLWGHLLIGIEFLKKKSNYESPNVANKNFALIDWLRTLISWFQQTFWQLSTQLWMITTKSHHTSMMLDKIFTSFINPSSREWVQFATAIAKLQDPHVDSCGDICWFGFEFLRDQPSTPKCCQHCFCFHRID